MIRKRLWNAAGFVALGLGAAGIPLPLLPTVPFFLLAAFCFARGSSRWEAWLLDHPRYGPPIRAWREGGVVSRKGKVAATMAFAVSILISLWTVVWPWMLIAPGVAVICLSWLWTRPESVRAAPKAD